MSPQWQKAHAEAVDLIVRGIITKDYNMVRRGRRRLRGLYYNGAPVELPEEVPGEETPTVTLQPLTLSNATIPEGLSLDTLIGVIGNKTAGSVLTLADTKGARFKIAGAQLVCGETVIEYDHGATWTLAIVETHPDAAAPRTTEFVITITEVVTVTLNALTLSPATVRENTAEGTAIGALTGMLPGVTLSLVEDAGGRVTLSGSQILAGAVAFNYEDTLSHTHTITVAQTLTGATNDGLETELTITVTDVDEIAPTITSPATRSIPENSAFSMTLTASEAVTWSKVGGADASLFTLSGATLSMTAKDYETPVDSGANNTYVVQVRATDGLGNATDQTITVTVTDVNEGVSDGVGTADRPFRGLSIWNIEIPVGATRTSFIGTYNGATNYAVGDMVKVTSGSGSSQENYVYVKKVAGAGHALPSGAASNTNWGWVPAGVSKWQGSTQSTPFYTGSNSDPAWDIRFNDNCYGNLFSGAWLTSGNSAAVESQIWNGAVDTFWADYNGYSTTNATPGSQPAPPTAGTYDPKGAGITNAALSPSKTLRIPAGVVPSGGNTDWTMVVFLPDGTVLETFATVVLSGNRIVCGSYKITDYASKAGDGWQNGFRASMIPGYAGLIQKEEWDAAVALDTSSGGTQGEIPHALALLAPKELLTRALVYPAYAWDAQQSLPYTGSVWPMGQRVALPSAFSISSDFDGRFGRIIARTLKKYGAIVVDRGGGGITLLCEQAVAATLGTYSYGNEVHLRRLLANCEKVSIASSEYRTSTQTTDSGTPPNNQAGLLKQEKSAVLTTAAKQISVTLDQVATSGNMLVAVLAVDDTSGTINTPSGWSALASHTAGTEISGLLFTKTAAGTEQALTFSWTNTELARVLVMEIEGVASGSLTVTSALDGTSDRTSLVLGPNAAVSGNVTALAIVAGDNGDAIGPTRTYSNGFEEILAKISEDIAPAIFVAKKDVTVVGETPQTTFTQSGGIADPAIGWLLTIPLDGTPPTPGTDTTPDAWSFTDVTGATLSTTYTHNTITVAGINAATPISVTGGMSYSKNGGSYTTSAGNVVNGDTVAVRLVSSNLNSTAVTGSLNIGGVVRNWTVTTAAASGGNVDIDEGMWKWTAPYNSSGGFSGTATEVWPNRTPNLLTLDNSSHDRQADGSIIMVAPLIGAKTSNTGYSRSEYRELLPDGSDEIAWTPAQGSKHEGTCAILELPTLTKGSECRVIFAQIHGPADEPCRLYAMKKSNGNLTFHFHDDKAGKGTNGTETRFPLFKQGTTDVEANVPMGAFFDWKVEMDDNQIRCTLVYNGETFVASSPLSNFWPGQACYTKVGCYNAVGEVGSGKVNEGTGQSRVHHKRIIAPIHPWNIP